MDAKYTQFHLFLHKLDESKTRRFAKREPKGERLKNLKGKPSFIS